MATVGIDMGRDRIGVAISELAGMAHPLGIIERRSVAKDIEALKPMLAGHEVAAIVVGLPLNMDGSEGASARMARSFAAALRDAFSVPVELADERLTSVEARDRMASAGGARRSAKDDALAA